MHTRLVVLQLQVTAGRSNEGRLGGRRRVCGCPLHGAWLAESANGSPSFFPCMAVCMQCSSIGRVRDFDGACHAARVACLPVSPCLPPTGVLCTCAMLITSVQSRERRRSLHRPRWRRWAGRASTEAIDGYECFFPGPGRAGALCWQLPLPCCTWTVCACVAISNRTADARKRPGHPSSRAPCCLPACLPLPLFFPYAPPTLQAAACTSATGILPVPVAPASREVIYPSTFLRMRFGNARPTERAWSAVCSTT